MIFRSYPGAGIFPFPDDLTNWGDKLDQCHRMLDKEFPLCLGSRGTQPHLQFRTNVQSPDNFDMSAVHRRNHMRHIRHTFRSPF